MTPIQSLLLGFALTTIVGAALLSLPVSSTAGKPQPFIDALFVATSGISTSGLSPVDIGSYYTFFGQAVLGLVFQIGGIGYMVFILLIAHILGHKPSLYSRHTFQESLAGIGLHDIRKMMASILLYTFFIEAAGAVVLAWYWAAEFPIAKAIWFGVFHSISAFCTAGFGLMPTSLITIRDSVIALVTVICLELAGGIGFFVLYDLGSCLLSAVRKNGSKRSLTVHSRLALTTTGIIVLAGTAVVFLSLGGNYHWTSRLLSSAFQVISASTTTGYNTLEIGILPNAVLVVLIILMFIGASPGSTAGGIKTTTLGVLFVSLENLLRGRTSVDLFKHTIPPETVSKASAIFQMACLLVGADLVILTISEKAAFLPVVFELVSAFGNTGLSMGITAHLSAIGKVVLIFTMFIGRVGPLSIGFSMLGKSGSERFKYGSANVYVG